MTTTPQPLPNDPITGGLSLLASVMESLASEAEAGTDLVADSPFDTCGDSQFGGLIIQASNAKVAVAAQYLVSLLVTIVANELEHHEEGTLPAALREIALSAREEIELWRDSTTTESA